jgi:enolase
MNAQELKQCIERAEQSADEAKKALGSASPDLRQAVESLHQQLSQAKHSAASQGDEQALRQSVLQLESTADRAMRACRQASQVDQKLQQAIEKAHEELSRAKKELKAGSPA